MQASLVSLFETPRQSSLEPSMITVLEMVSLCGHIQTPPPIPTPPTPPTHLCFSVLLG